jgi:hypothetical protein
MEADAKWINAEYADVHVQPSDLTRDLVIVADLDGKHALVPPVWSAVTPVTALTASVRAASRGRCNPASCHHTFTAWNQTSSSAPSLLRDCAALHAVGATLHTIDAALHSVGATLHTIDAALHSVGATLHTIDAALHSVGAMLHPVGETLQGVGRTVRGVRVTVYGRFHHAAQRMTPTAHSGETTVYMR